MSDCRAIRCDRCGIKEVLPEHGMLDCCSVVSLARNKPYNLDHQKDLCSDCTNVVLAAMMRPNPNELSPSGIVNKILGTKGLRIPEDSKPPGS